MLRDLVEKTLFFPTANITFFNPEDYPWVAPVEAEWLAIRKELDALLVKRDEIPNFQDLSHDQRVLTEGA
jgi:ornithine lipid ester-linked acyl 2-hydroxylase